MKVNAYICVDKDGTEKITNSMPLRRKFEGIRLLDIIVGFLTGNYSKNNWNKLCDEWSTDEKDCLPFSGVILPRGTIKKIIGKELTWEDEPIELT